MPAPRLIHPVSVTILPLDRTATRRDKQAREPIPAQARSAPVVVQAQVHWSRMRDLDAQANGPGERYDGFLVFLRADLETAGYSPGPGDRVTAIEEATQAAIYLTGNAQQRGQYHGAYHLVRCFFEDRMQRRD